ncbi:peptidylprolyl isomerase [Candidatus Fermentibacterales bacterium]|nr:peptidylprolyl isomerase [Candidatus Fermentibacterales bacterium]
MEPTFRGTSAAAARRSGIVLAAVVGAVGLGILFFSLGPVLTGDHDHDNLPGRTEHDIAARVGDSMLLEEELAMLEGNSATVEQWVEDEMLAQLAVEQGLEDPRTSRLVERRARQVYLRDLMVEQSLSTLEWPTDSEVMEFMRSDSLLNMVERHYYHMLVADSSLADSLYGRLQRGEHFQTMVERVSSGQKAALGGDLGFLTGAELTGFPRAVGTLDGLSGIHVSTSGYHIFLVAETRELTDTARVLTSLSDILYRRRVEARIDSLVELARAGREVEVNERWRASE